MRCPPTGVDDIQNQSFLVSVLLGGPTCPAVFRLVDAYQSPFFLVLALPLRMSPCQAAALNSPLVTHLSLRTYSFPELPSKRLSGPVLFLRPLRTCEFSDSEPVLRCLCVNVFVLDGRRQTVAIYGIVSPLFLAGQLKTHLSSTRLALTAAVGVMVYRNLAPL